MTDSIVPDGHPYAVCLTHDVDRPTRTYQAIPEAIDRRSLAPLTADRDPYWQFETITDLERDLGVRSSFYFLQEPPLFRMGGPRAWLAPHNWLEHLGRYDVTSDRMARVIRRLDRGGWEVGLHGSRRASRDTGRLRWEKRRLERLVGHPVVGCRHHHLRLAADTWERQQSVGFRYDASLGSSRTCGGGSRLHPFHPTEGFTVVPLTAMEVALPDPGESFQAALERLRELCRSAAADRGVLTVLWHVRYFARRQFPGYRRLYRRLIEHTLADGAWVGSIGALLGAGLEAPPRPLAALDAP